MIGAAHVAAAGWRTVGVVLLHGTVLAAVAWLLAATVLRRARPAVLAALWSVVLVKFALPIGPALPFSLSDALSRLLSSAPPDVAQAVTVVPVAGHAAAPVAGPWAWLALAAAALWLAGVAVIAARGVRLHRRARRLALALPPAGADVRGLARAIAGRLGLGRVPDLRVGADGAGPWLCGLRRPVVVVPAGLAGPARRAELTAALTHELAHLRRRDAWLRLVQVAVGTLLFFWPVVRWVNRRVDAAREMACDAWAVAAGPLAPAAYARFLVRLVAGGAPAPAAALGLAAPSGLLRGRVEAVLGARPDRGPSLGKIGVAGLAVWTPLALGGAAHASDAAARARVCRYTPQIAETILAAHPEADVDGDGVLTRAEACDFELAVKRRMIDQAIAVGAEPLPLYDAAFDADHDGRLSSVEAANRLDHLAEAMPSPMASPLAPDGLCCDCAAAGGSSPRLTQPEPSAGRPALEPVNTCVRGVSP
jgi:beta-lactamase regulating signal transducer with metallopeptidase domain